MSRDAKLVGLYVSLLGAAAAAFALVRHLGESLRRRGSAGAERSSARPPRRLPCMLWRT